MATRKRATRIAALACAGAMMLTGCDFSVYNLPLPGGADLGENPYSVRVQFLDVLDLVPQSSVKVNDVSVGKVDEVKLDGYNAEVTVLLRDDVELPDNAVAKIRQTSLLGEKFVSLEAPETGASGGLLEDGDLIPLDRSGRNPEVEEVLGAMSLLFNGGGVAQLKTISVELNRAFEGRESDVKGVLQQIDLFMGQLDKNKGDIISAIESLNKLAISIKEQRSSIELALDEMPATLASIDRQRDDLVKMLRALSELSAVGTKVISQSKATTIRSLEQLDPILTKLGEAGDALPNALQVFLTYPFVDQVVGKNPAQARDLHMGDYTNLSVQLDLDLRGGGGPDLPVDPGAVLSDVEKCLQSADPTSQACQDLSTNQLRRLCNAAPSSPLKTALCGTGGGGGPVAEELTPVDRCLKSKNPDSPACKGLNDGQRQRLVRRCAESPLNPVCRDLPAGTGGGGGGGPLPDIPGVPRTATGMSWFEDKYSLTVPENAQYDSTLGSLLLQGVANR